MNGNRYYKKNEWSLPETECAIAAPLDESFPSNPYNTFRLIPGRKVYIKKRSALSFAEIPNGSVISQGMMTTISDENNIKLDQFSYTIKDVPNIIMKEIEINGVAVNCLSNWGARNYCHFLLEVVPRLYVTTLSSNLPSAILCDQAAPQSAEAILSYFHPNAEIIRVPFGTKARASLLHVSSPMAHPMHTAQPDLLRWMRERVPVSAQHRPLYIERPQGRRGISNQDDLAQLLLEYNFTVIRAEELTFADQVDAFAGASLVLAAHGAGLANIIFCRAGTPVIELMPRAYATPAYWILAGAAGYPYYPIMDARWAEPHGDIKSKFEDIVVDCDKLRQALELLDARTGCLNSRKR